MSLKPSRQTEQVNIDYITPWTQERGGCLCFGMVSGISIAQYVFNPSGVHPIGVQLNDIEWMNLGRQYHRTFLGYTTELPCGIVGIGTQGDFITDWIYIIGSVMPGDDAFVGPSGTFTNTASLGGRKIGEFRSALESDPHYVTMRGFGFSRQYTDTCTKSLVWENNPADSVLVPTPGYAKIRIDIGYQGR